jgi:hypothetical protein
MSRERTRTMGVVGLPLGRSAPCFCDAAANINKRKVDN